MNYQAVKLMAVVQIRRSAPTKCNIFQYGRGESMYSPQCN